MLLVSTSSTSPILAIPNDRFFRFCPSDVELAPALIDVLWSYGVKTIIIFQRGDSWGDGIVNLFIPAWKAKGGSIVGEKIRYSAEATEFSNYLEIANQQAKSALSHYGGDVNKVGVLLLAFDEAPVILKQASQYHDLFSLKWWGSDGTARSQRIIDDSPQEGIHVGVYSLLSRDPITSKYLNIQARFEALTHQQFSIYSAYLYDAAFAIAKSVIEASSNNATTVATILPQICNDMYVQVDGVG
jgi:branched-chain amino acid transport system substrate-binding protein